MDLKFEASLSTLVPGQPVSETLSLGRERGYFSLLFLLSILHLLNNRQCVGSRSSAVWGLYPTRKLPFTSVKAKYFL